MLPFFLYLLKVSLGILLVYAFYQTVMRGLTFYTANRWCLLLLSLFCFLLPLVNVGELIEEKPEGMATVVQYIPTVAEYVGQPGTAGLSTNSISLDLWDIVFLVWMAGSLLLLARLLIGYHSYRKLRKAAQLYIYNGMRLFRVDRPLLPFSFVNDIYLNPQRHTEAEMKKIIRHELVHVRQRHTVDVIWAELLCTLCWFNPFAWLLRHAIRQNLEFIADSNVVQHGADKQAYQYLLLNVMGGVAYPVAHQFNFSAVKQRIIMLNRHPSAKSNCIRFLLVLPLAGVLLVACRSKKEGIEVITAGNKATYSGIILDATTYKGLPGVAISEPTSGTQTQTDGRGFYILNVPAAPFKTQTNISFSKAGYGSFSQSKTFKAHRAADRDVSIIKMKKAGVDGVTALATSGVPIEAGAYAAPPTYEEAAVYLPARIASWKAQDRFELARIKTSEVYMVFEGQTYVMSGGGWASVDEVTEVVFVDGIKMNGAEVNRKLARKEIVSLGAMDRSVAKEKLGIDGAVLQIYTQRLAER